MRRFLFALAALLLLQVGARADERIHQFTSEATVNVDGSLDVTETISINAEGLEIKRGILRDFPTLYKDRNGINVRIDFEVRGVERDGNREPFAIEGQSNGVRVRIGDKDVFLDRGEHTYRIFYHTTRQLGFFEKFDELYWNVTGNGSTFPIDHANAIINLPAGARASNPSTYTGVYGTNTKASTILSQSGNIFEAETTQTLQPGEGFTVAVAWQKGIVAPPTPADRQAWFLRDNVGLFSLFSTLFLVILYYLYAWKKVGRDPQGGTIIPLFRPPADIGPAGVRYIWKQGFDNRAFAAAIVGLAVKGGLAITDDGSNFTITKKSGMKEQLTRSELELYGALPNSALNLLQSNHVAVASAKDKLASILSKEYNGAMFVKNISWFVWGAIISVLGLVVSIILMGGSDASTGLFIAVWGAIWWGVILTFAWTAVRGLSNGGNWFRRIASIGQLIFLLPFGLLGAGVPIAVMLDSSASPELGWSVAGAIVLSFLNILFYYLMKAPTQIGRKILDEIEGFRMYMDTAEEERLKILQPPEKTPDLFEKYLPYALALDCENQWNAKFASVLAAAAATGAVVGNGWYHGNTWNADRSSDFTDRLGSSLTSSVSSSSTAPGSSSGSSGGGFSGGGGGGGGTSGW